MPYVGLKDGTRVGPWQVEDRDVTCPSCTEPMYLKGGPDTQRELHFCHYPSHSSKSGGSEGCSGESDTHRRMKAIAAKKARDLYPDATVEIEVETAGIDIVRQADVLITFAEAEDNLGLGIAVECQHRNEGKDLDAVARDHALAGHSTFYLTDAQFSDRDANLGAADIRPFRRNWPPAPEHWGDVPEARDLPLPGSGNQWVNIKRTAVETEATIPLTWLSDLRWAHRRAYHDWLQAYLDGDPDHDRYRPSGYDTCADCDVTLPIEPKYSDKDLCPECRPTKIFGDQVIEDIKSGRHISPWSDDERWTYDSDRDPPDRSTDTESSPEETTPSDVEHTSETSNEVLYITEDSGGPETRSCGQKRCYGEQRKASEVEAVSYNYGWVCLDCGFHHGSVT